MGTRADFYVGVGETAEWIGSVAWDGYEWAEDKSSDIAKACTESEYRDAVKKMFSGRDDASTPQTGWPWPWDNSSLTDYVYYFKDGKTNWKEFDKVNKWPDMKKVKNVALGSRKSGLIIIG
jgi:hypothetical protein